MKYFKLAMITFVFLMFAKYSLADLNDGLPNQTLTPGILNPNVHDSNINNTICISGWTKTIRPSSSYTNSLKFKQIKEYNYSETDPRKFEEDHKIPLALGGHPADLKNLWPQPRFGEWNSEKKDVLESFLHKEVCKGNVPLADAQSIFMRDWTAGYRKYITKTTPKIPTVD